MLILYIYCMQLVREIWKFIHPRISYSLRATWVNKFSYFLNLHAINVLLYRMKQRKDIHVKYCWQTYFKSVGTLSQTLSISSFDGIWKRFSAVAIVLYILVACKWCVPSVSDIFLSKNDNSDGRTRETSEGVEYEYFFLLQYDWSQQQK